MQLEFALLDEESNIQSFDCGEDQLNYYLTDLALLFQRRRFGVTIIMFDKNDSKKKVMGFYTLCPASVQLDSLPEKFLKGPKPNPIPAFRICRLAIDKHFQGKGLGQLIFIHALQKCLDQSSQIGGSIIIIDAKHEKAKSFYERFGFISLLNNPLILVQTIKYIQLHFNS